MVVYEDNLHKTLSRIFQFIWILLIILLIFRIAMRFFQGALGSADISPIVAITTPIYIIFENTAEDIGSQGFVVDLSAVIGIFVVILFILVGSKFIDILVYSGISTKLQKSISAFLLFIQSILLLHFILKMFIPEADSIFSQIVNSIASILIGPFEEIMPTAKVFRLTFVSTAAVGILLIELLKQILLFVIVSIDFTQKSPIKSDTIISHSLKEEAEVEKIEAKEKPLNLELPAIAVTNNTPIYNNVETPIVNTQANSLPPTPSPSIPAIPATQPVNTGQTLPPIPDTVSIPVPNPLPPVQTPVMNNMSNINSQSNYTAPAAALVQPLQPLPEPTTSQFIQQVAPNSGMVEMSAPLVNTQPIINNQAPFPQPQTQAPIQPDLQPSIPPVQGFNPVNQQIPVIPKAAAVSTPQTESGKKISMQSVKPHISKVQSFFTKTLPNVINKLTPEDHTFESNMKKDSQSIPVSPLAGLPPLPRTVNTLPSNHPQSSKSELPSNPFRGS